MKNIYNDKTYLTNNPTWHAEDSSFKAEKIVNLLKKNTFDYETICEIGCGSGEILIQLESQLSDTKNLYGYDISQDAIRIAKEKETEKIKFEVKDITKENASSFFDLILVIDVIEHLENYFDFLRNIVHKSNYTIFHIPLDMCLWTLFREKMLIESKNRVGHIHNFTEEFIENILTDIGFEIIDKIYTEPFYKTNTLKQKVVKSLRKFIYSINKKFCTKTIGGYSIMLLAKNKHQQYEL